jgi:hypothetical protein
MGPEGIIFLKKITLFFPKRCNPKRIILIDPERGLIKYLKILFVFYAVYLEIFREFSFGF